MMRWLRKSHGDSLAVSMSSVKLGNRLLIVGGSDVTLIAALAAKAGLTGRTCMIDEAESISTRSAGLVEREGVLIESFTAEYSSLPFEVSDFDVAILRNVLTAMDADYRSKLASEVHRVLRQGGRCVVIEGSSRNGLSALFGGDRGGAQSPSEETIAQILRDRGFRAVRTLAQREGLLFVEGVKPGSS